MPFRSIAYHWDIIRKLSWLKPSSDLSATADLEVHEDQPLAESVD